MANPGMVDAFAFHAYAGWQPDSRDKLALRAMVYQEGWEPDWGDGTVLLVRQVMAHCACHAIRRFRQWQREGYGDSWLQNQPVGEKCAEFTVTSSFQECPE